MPTNSRQLFGQRFKQCFKQRSLWAPISSDPNSPIGFLSANREFGSRKIGRCENDTDDSESDGSLSGATMARFYDASDTGNELRPNTHSTNKLTSAKGTPRRGARSNVVHSETRPVPHAATLPDGAPQSTTDSPIAKECSFKSWLEQDALMEKTTREYQPPNPIDVLQHMIQRVGVHHPERYGVFLASDDRVSQLEEMILPEAWDILKSRDYSLQQLLQLPQDVGPEDSGIYVHIIWLKHNPDRFYLYVGQSTQLQARIQAHRDPLYRAGHRTLHYHVWDYFPTNGLEIEERFVFLSII
ncbi:hypothetical protein P154DRAFT_623926 [Amniculicola lignicola CBS 123094]|uniref:GIY-YIG domain-containing protein n=1 Tax=Amniculicola lignicola CBS 123094 TaxID=1392246 RepID=A0A6A5W3F1_9PLEO|nr:hypothetical protein P154DRAFT_623926 [Amniculicola lignicola CBS 123094]